MTGCDLEEPHFLNSDYTVNNEWLKWAIEKSPDHELLNPNGVILAKMVLMQLRLTGIVKACWEDHGDDAIKVLVHSPEVRVLLKRLEPPKSTLFKRFALWIKGK